MCLLAADFHMKVKMGTYPTVTYDASCMSIDALNHICAQKLFWTHQVCQQQEMIDSYPEEQQQDTILKHATIRTIQQKQDRSTVQRQGVCYWCPLHICLLTHYPLTP